MSRMGTRSYVTREKKRNYFFLRVSKRKSSPLPLSSSAREIHVLHIIRELFILICNAPNDLGNPEALRDDLWVDYN